MILGVSMKEIRDAIVDAYAPLELRDTVGIPSGYHPVCAAPGYRLYYCWVLSGPVRRLEISKYRGSAFAPGEFPLSFDFPLQESRD
jgi:5-deoxy-D-glucuronate isomerase